MIRIGLHGLGIASGARRGMIEAVAGAAEAAGFSTLWVGEHVVMFDRSRSRYPYSAEGEIPVPADADWLDPFVCLSFAAAATSTIAIATGVLLLPEHNPVLVAKQAASLDSLSGGRLTLGVGVGWSREEFAALGVPFEHRGRRTAEYIAAIREIWEQDAASFSGEFVEFEAIRVYPKPARGRRLPVVFGGNSEPALRRVAELGDGWYGFNLAGVEEVAERVGRLRAHCRDANRDFGELTIAAAVNGAAPSDLAELERLGVTELVLVQAPPEDPQAAPEWVRSLARRWLAGAA